MKNKKHILDLTRQLCVLGIDLRYVIHKAKEISKKIGKPVQFRFNDRRIKLSWRQPDAHVYNQWLASIRAKSSRYLNSPEGKSEEEEHQKTITESQKVCDHFAEFIHTNTPSLNTLILALAPFVDASGWSGVTIDHEQLVADLTALGYDRSFGIDQPEEWFNTRERAGRYIIGQVIACLSIGMPPHQVCSRFIQQYLDIPDQKIAA